MSSKNAFNGQVMSEAEAKAFADQVTQNFRPSQSGETPSQYAACAATDAIARFFVAHGGRMTE